MHLKSYDWAEWFCCPKVAKIGKTIRANLVHLPYKCSNHLLHHENVDPFGVLEATSCFCWIIGFFCLCFGEDGDIMFQSFLWPNKSLERFFFETDVCLLKVQSLQINSKNPANRSSQKEIACSSHPFSGANCYFQGGYALSLHKR